MLFTVRAQRQIAVHVSQPGFFSELKRRNVYKVGVGYAVVAWVVLQAASILLPTFDAPAWALRLVVLLCVLGFPVALILAWAFEFTPEGIKRAESVRREHGSSDKTRRGVVALVMLAAVAGAALFILQTTIGNRAAKVPERSIAVLPLINSSGDPEQEYFSDGLSEELINGLAQLPELRVIGRSSSFRFKGKVEDARRVGEALGVSHFVEGSVRKAGDRVRISVALVNAKDGTQRWSQSYDRELKDIFTVQEEIARSVANQLSVALLGKNVRSPAEPSNQSLEAFNAYLQGEFHFAQFNIENTRRAIDAYKEAVRLDPTYPKAFAALAWAYCRLGFFSGAKGGAAFVEAQAAAERALSLNPKLALAHSASAYVHMNLHWDLAAAEAELLEAERIAPQDSTVKNTLANLRSYQVRREEALRLRQDAVALDPLNVTIHVNIVSDLIALGRHDEAAAVARRGLELQPSASQLHAALSRILMERGEADAALAEAKLEPAGIYERMAIALAETARGDQAAADAALGQLIREHSADNPWRIAVVYAYRGEGEKMFEWLERAYAIRDPRMINTATHPYFDRYRADPRMVAICDKVRLPVPPTARH
ncbi:MAG TPA: hypothetical protein VF551_02605 [Chthoniobacterales bacterium]